MYNLEIYRTHKKSPMFEKPHATFSGKMAFFFFIFFFCKGFCLEKKFQNTFQNKNFPPPFLKTYKLYENYTKIIRKLYEIIQKLYEIYKKKLYEIIRKLYKNYTKIIQIISI